MTATIHHARRGFTLMEILIAVLIIGLLGGIMVPALNTIFKNQQKRAAQATMQTIKKGISMYQLHTQQLPTTLKDLITKPKDERIAKKWEAGYLGEDTTEVPEDPWGNKYVYKLTPGGKKPYELYSYGPEGKGAPKDQWIYVD